MAPDAGTPESRLYICDEARSLTAALEMEENLMASALTIDDLEERARFVTKEMSSSAPRWQDLTEGLATIEHLVGTS